MRRCGEHILGSADDIVFCIRPWFHRLPFAAGICPDSNQDEVIAIFYLIGVSDFGDILRDRRFAVAL
jgi:hypothetical protein